MYRFVYHQIFVIIPVTVGVIACPQGQVSYSGLIFANNGDLCILIIQKIVDSFGQSGGSWSRSEDASEIVENVVEHGK